MKKTVVDIEDLQQLVPFFRSRFGTFLGKKLLKWFSIEKVNQAHANSCHLRGSAFTTALLNDPLIDITIYIMQKFWTICRKVLLSLFLIIRSDLLTVLC